MRSKSHGRDGDRMFLSRSFKNMPRLVRLTCQSKGRSRIPESSYPSVGSRRERLGCTDNGHLNFLAESIDVNVGGCPETDVPSSREEKHGQRRCLHSSRRSGKPATCRREAVRCETEAD